MDETECAPSPGLGNGEIPLSDSGESLVGVRHATVSGIALMIMA
jgi:hypothetical protein